MSRGLSRRTLLELASTALPFRTMNLPEGLLGSGIQNAGSDRALVSDTFPTQSPEPVREMVTVAHFDFKRVKELVEAHTSLAKAAWDWGFGDWETALGAASHMGARQIAEYLISQGARPSLFSAAMFGQFEAVRDMVKAQPGVQRIRGPHGISLLAHARMGGDAARSLVEFLQSVGDADTEPPVSLSDAEAFALAGTYVFGVGASQQVEVTTDLKMYANNKMYTHPPQLNWTRTGTMSRPLFHLGGKTFYPAGAPSVRIRFTDDAGTALMTVIDAELVLTARRHQ